MGCYLITYDLNKETKRPPIVDKIREFEGWARLSESSYAVSSNLNPDEIHKQLSSMLDDNDQFYVITLRKPLAGQGDGIVNEWLENTVPW